MLLSTLPASAQWSQAHEQTYLPAEHNWKFRRDFPAADGLFNAFDYGHAVLYEELYTRPGAAAERLEEDEYRFLTEKLLQNPPHVPLEEGAIEVAYAKLAPEAKIMFEWAHVLHRQIYDVLADERLSWPEKDAEVAELLRYYKSRPEYAFSSVPKSMALMEGQYYSTAFREKYPKFNGLIWAYHWLQVGLYEPLMIFEEENARQRGVTASVARFWHLLEEAPANMPRMMPMTPAVAPTFAARYPEAAIIFDNLHSMHDVISDILTSPEVPRGAKRQEILIAAERYKDDTSFAMTVQEWREMADMMGIENMGGVASNILQPLPEPTAPIGATAMGGMDHGNMQGMNRGATPGNQQGGTTGMQGMNHDAMMQGMDHGSMAGMESSAAMPEMQMMSELHGRMMADSVIQERVMADPEMRQMAQEVEEMEMQRAMQFVVRLLSDPQVEPRIHADPGLHQLWTNPRVQEHLRLMRETNGQQAAGDAGRQPASGARPGAQGQQHGGH